MSGTWNGLPKSRASYTRLPLARSANPIPKSTNSANFLRHIEFTLFSMNVAIYFLYPTGVAGPGPRYFLAYFPFLVLAVVDLYQRMSRDSQPSGRHLWNFAIVSLVMCSLVFVTEEAYTMYWRRDLDRTARHIKDGKKIFLLKTGTYHTA